MLNHQDNAIGNYLLQLGHNNPPNEPNDTYVIKAELLCYGLKLTEEQLLCAEKINPFIREKGFVHAVHIKYKNAIINTCVAEKFCQKSPYRAKIIDSQWHLLKNEFDLGIFTFLSMPDWTNEEVGKIKIGSIIRPHADKCISLWPSTSCTYEQRGEGCQFCCLLSSEEKSIISVQEIIHAVNVALSFNPHYEINLSGGTCGDRNTAISYLSSICSGIKRKHDVPISVECAPPTSVDKLVLLNKSGATSIIMNIEIYDEQLRKKICPGKSEISVGTYMDMLHKAVSIFGRGNVSSVLIVGIQPEEDVREACRKLVNIGVVPTLIPFKPLDNTPMANHPVVNADSYITLSKYLARNMISSHLGICSNSGCASCGACSLETDLCK